MKLGLISDTHGLLRPSAVEALTGSQLIVHAGDVGKPEILRELRAIAPVLAVRGNIDQGDWANALPETAEAEVDGVRLYVIHDVHALAIDPSAYHIVISGHSHKSSSQLRDGVLYLNPGAAGPRRFRLPITVAALDTAVRPWAMRLIELAGI